MFGAGSMCSISWWLDCVIGMSNGDGDYVFDIHTGICFPYFNSFLDYYIPNLFYISL